MTQNTVKCQDRRLYTGITACYMWSLLRVPREKGQMTQETDECPNRQLYIDKSAWVTDAKIVSVFERTDYHGQYEGHKGSF